MTLKLAQWTKDQPDFECLHAWRNHTQVRRFSFNPKPLEYEAFCSSFEKKISRCRDLHPLWILKGSQKVGFIYFQPWFRKNAVQVSLFLDPHQTKLGIGTWALKETLSLLESKGVEQVIALVLSENEASQGLFLKLDFEGPLPVYYPRGDEEHLCQKWTYSFKHPTHKTFIIAEAGSNYKVGSIEEDLRQGKKLIEKAYQARANAVKFQLYDAKSVYAKGAGCPEYLKEDIHALFDYYALHKKLIQPLKNYADLLGIEWMCSAFSVEHFNQINSFVKRHKIASYELGHLRLIEAAAKANKPLILSTGASAYQEIDWAVNTYKELGGKDLTLMHCNAQYPAEPRGLNLNCIKALIERYQIPIGFSDHSSHPTLAPTIAVTLGAKIIEKHFTLSRDLKGPDHFFALEPHELNCMVEAIIQTEQMLGLAKKEIFPQEEALAQFAKRSLQALKPISKGELFKEGCNVAFLRPGHQKPGLHPRWMNQIEGKKAVKDLDEGVGITLEDVQWI